MTKYRFQVLAGILMIALTPASAQQLVSTGAPSQTAPAAASNDTALAEQAAHRYVAEYNRGYAEWTYAVHAKDASWTELPVHGVYPGHVGGPDDLKKLGEQTLKTFPDRKFRLISVVANGRRGAMELEWSGTARVATSQAKAGEKITLRQAAFFEINEEGKIIREVDYTIRI